MANPKTGRERSVQSGTIVQSTTSCHGPNPGEVRAHSLLEESIQVSVPGHRAGWSRAEVSGEQTGISVQDYTS